MILFRNNLTAGCVADSALKIQFLARANPTAMPRGTDPSRLSVSSLPSGLRVRLDRLSKVCLAATALLFSTQAQAQEAPASKIQAPDARDLVTIDGHPLIPDPWEGLNRRAFAFNEGLDHAIIGPIVHGYMRVAPVPVQRALTSVVSNLREPRIAINDLVQGHPGLAGQALARFAINSTIGVLGLADVASNMNITKHQADFGQTMGRYRIRTGPYLYIPVVGPLDVRDGLGRVLDAASDPISIVAGGVTTGFGAGRLVATAVDVRASNDGQIDALASDATDPYAALRSAYSQRRAFLVRAATGEPEILSDFDPPPGSP